MNKIILSGRLTKDPVLTNNNGKLLVKFSLANPDRKDSPDFFNCTAFDKTAENIANQFVKGKPITIIGRVQTSTYTDPTTNQKKYSWEIIVYEYDFHLNDSTKSIQQGNPMPAPMNQLQMQQPMNQPQMQQPMNQPQMQQPMNQPQMQQPMNQPQMQQPMNQPQMQQPMNQPQMQQPMNQPQMQQLNQPVQNSQQNMQMNQGQNVPGWATPWVNAQTN